MTVMIFARSSSDCKRSYRKEELTFAGSHNELHAVVGHCGIGVEEVFYSGKVN